MKVTPAFVQDEIIGFDAKVVKSTNPSSMGIKGRVIDETRNTLTLRHASVDKVITKNTVILHLSTADGTIVEVDGSIMSGRPEDRVKKHSKRRW